MYYSNLCFKHAYFHVLSLVLHIHINFIFQQFATKLDEQLSKGGSSNAPYQNYQNHTPASPSHSYPGQSSSQSYNPTSPGQPPFSPTGQGRPSYPSGGSHPGAPDYNYSSPSSSQGGVSSPYGQSYGSSPQSFSPTAQSYGDPYSPPSHTAGPGGPQVPQSPTPAVPDAVLNMAARGAPDKKPWAYAPDANALKEQRDRVRRR